MQQNPGETRLTYWMQKMMKSELMDVVDENDIVIGTAERSEIYSQKLRHRIVHVFLADADGKFCLQLRSKTMSFAPGHWAPSAGGHVKSGETYKEAALRELEEELGITAELTLLRKDFYSDLRGNKKFIAAFSAPSPGNIVINHEVEAVAFFGPEEIRRMINDGEKFHPELLFLLRLQFGIF